MKTGLHHPKGPAIIQFHPTVAMRNRVTRYSGFSSEDGNLEFNIKVSNFQILATVRSIKNKQTCIQARFYFKLLAGHLTFRS